MNNLGTYYECPQISFCINILPYSCSPCYHCADEPLVEKCWDHPSAFLHIWFSGIADLNYFDVLHNDCRTGVVPNQNSISLIMKYQLNIEVYTTFSSYRIQRTIATNSNLDLIPILNTDNQLYESWNTFPWIVSYKYQWIVLVHCESSSLRGTY